MDYVRYIDKTRDYYLAQGYEKPYQWAHFDEVPFTPLSTPLASACVALVSTSDVAVRADDGAEDSSHDQLLVGSTYSIPSDLPEERFYSRQEHYDKYATHLDDVNSYFPITRLHELAEAGRVGSVAARCHGVYTQYSQRRTTEIEAPEVLRRCREDGVDVAILTPV
jgi:D-proline reductase (dithiol) PrdB